MIVASFGAVKGGTGKTTSLVLTGRCLAKAGKKVLTVGLDVNSSLEQTFNPANLGDIDRDNKRHIAACLMNVSRMDDMSDFIIPSNTKNIDILRVDSSLTRVNFNSPYLLKNKIRESGLDKLYDVVLLDTPANYFALHIAAFNASDVIVTPVMPSKYDFVPINQLGINLKLDTDNSARWGLFFNGFRPEIPIQKEYMNAYLENYPNFIPDVIVPYTQQVKYATDAAEKIGKAKTAEKLRTAVCRLASFIVAEPVDPEGTF